MSMTLDTLWSLHGWAGHPDLPQAVEFVARRGGSRSTHFLFFGSGAGSLLFLPLAIAGAFGGYLLRNPDKARGLKERLRGAWGAAAAGLQSGGEPTNMNRGGATPPYQPPKAPP